MAACGAVKGENAAGKNELQEGKDKSVVYFAEDISPEGLVKIYGKINENIKGKTAIKVHTGEPHGPNIIPRDMVKALQKTIPPEEESRDLKERIESRSGLRQLSYMKELGMGNNEYELVNID